MGEDYHPEQFRSVESEEEEEEENASKASPRKCEEKCDSNITALSGAISTTVIQPSVEIQFTDAKEIQQKLFVRREMSDDSEFSNLSDSCDEIETHLLREDSSIPDRAMQNRYQGFAERIDLSLKEKGRIRDRKDFATIQHVLDRRTQITLFTMMQQKLFHTINGCVSTGKEANVYHAIGNLKDRRQTEVNYAVKVYMTSTTSFRDRSQYVTGDYRMRHTAPHRRSTYAMVRVWAEKEFRNLCRIFNSGKIAAPRPIKVKGVVLLMEFVGDDDGNAAPRLKDALVEDDEEWTTMYWEVVRQMRVLFRECGLVHGDLNEYNMLYHDDRPWIIDVSQSVMHEKNPNALLFLRKDVDNVTTFFCNKNVECLTVRELFNFIVTSAIGGPSEGVVSSDPIGEQRAAEAAHLESAKRLAQNRPDDYTWEEAGAFLEEHIPINLAEVERPARDIRAVRTGKASADDLLYASMAGLQTKDFLSIKAKKRLEMKREREKRIAEIEERDADKSDTDEKVIEEDSDEGTSRLEGTKVDSKDSEDDTEKSDRFVHPSRPAHESPTSRRRRKAEVKAAQREQRVTKKEQRIKWEKKERAKQAKQPKFTRLL